MPLRDEFGTTAEPGVFVAGDGAGLRGAWVAAAEGRIVGATASLTAQGRALYGNGGRGAESRRGRR